MLWFVPIERLEERYTVFTSDMIRRELARRFEVEIVYGNRTRADIKNGVFLDFADTIFFKSSQMSYIASQFDQGRVGDGDVFFIEDLWFPGIQAIKYMAELFGIRVFVTGIMHAGSWTPSDVVSRMAHWARPFEESVFRMCHLVFVGSKFHKNEIVHAFEGESIMELWPKIKVTGLAFSPEYIDETKGPVVVRNPKQVVFPFRPHLEKGIKFLNDIAERLGPKGFKFVLPTYRKEFVFDNEAAGTRSLELCDKGFIEMERNVTKARLYQIMESSGIVLSAAIQENYGYAVLESVYLGCTPVLPSRLSYPEFFNRLYLYKGLDEAADMVELFSESPMPCVESARAHGRNVERMAAEVARMVECGFI